MEITIMICNKKNILQFPSIKNSLFLQECLEEKKRSKDQLFNGNLSQVIDGLRDQLNSQKETMKKYEGKIKKRDAEVSQVKYMSLLLYVHRKRDDFSLSLYLPSHQGSTPPPSPILLSIKLWRITRPYLAIRTIFDIRPLFGVE